eukprot:CAMPEP_0197588846 /NCGR_PEP_ID=MMETSP1326-20131121/9987_1 /TAXON_ID=1155430 /ORGANISM="Genus nov. species nov., Strain RCC2288" /LENGTH=279 /DNA_ID=CAMNT_0043153719 /DNA_START=90 /DNA_END=929 /DNA_ORIENTATION=+
MTRSMRSAAAPTIVLAFALVALLAPHGASAIRPSIAKTLGSATSFWSSAFSSSSSSSSGDEAAAVTALSSSGSGAHDAAVGAAVAAAAASPPWFCHGIDCPAFTTLATSKAYDTRAYPAGLVWTSTVVTGMAYDDAVGVGFMRLFKYISGENAEKAKVPMTAPVRVRVVPGAGPFCESNFTISFFVPFTPGSSTQIDPPAPTDPAVFTEVDPQPFTAYVRHFPGYETEKTLLHEAAALGAALEADGKGGGFVADHFFFAGYDSPFRPLGRHNEVWFMQA